MACKSVQRKALQPIVPRCKTRKIPLGVTGKVHKQARQGTRTGIQSAQNEPKLSLACSEAGVGVPRNKTKLGSIPNNLEDRSPNQNTIFNDGDHAVEPLFKRLRFKQPSPIGHADRANAQKRSHPQTGTCKRPKQEGQIGRGISIAKVVARNPNLARKFPHLYDRPPDNTMLADVNTPK